MQADQEVLRRLPAILRREGYFDSYSSERPLHLQFRWMRERLHLLPDTLRTLTTLFFLGEPVPDEALRGVFLGSELDALERLGILLHHEGQQGIGALALLPLLGQLVFVPWAKPAKQDAAFSDESAAHAARTAPPRHARCLDLYAGPGHLTVRCATLAESVVAVDVSPVALACAKLNVVLNSVDDRASIREGEVADVVGPEASFDYVTATPPTLPYPPEFPVLGRAVSGDDGLLVLRRTLAQVARLLAPDGTAQLLATAPGDQAGPHFLRELPEFAAEHALHIITTLPRRTRMRAGDALFEELARTCAPSVRPRPADLEAARERLTRYLGERDAAYLYSLRMTITASAPRPGLQVVEHFRVESSDDEWRG